MAVRRELVVGGAMMAVGGLVLFGVTVFDKAMTQPWSPWRVVAFAVFGLPVYVLGELCGEALVEPPFLAKHWGSRIVLFGVLVAIILAYVWYDF